MLDKKQPISEAVLRWLLATKAPGVSLEHFHFLNSINDVTYQLPNLFHNFNNLQGTD